MYRARAISLVGSLLLFFGAAAVPAQERRVVRPQYGSFGLEVLVGGGPLDVIYGRGRRYVEAREGAEYELLLRNPLPVRVAVALSVDGLNTIDARRASAWDSSKWVIEPYQTITISGWQMSRERARRFYFTNERDAYATRLGRPSDLGVITAVFYRERYAGGGVITPPRPEPRPMERKRRGEAEDAPRSDSGAAASRAPDRSV